jgi:hypothetical protein
MGLGVLLRGCHGCWANPFGRLRRCWAATWRPVNSVRKELALMPYLVRFNCTTREEQAGVLAGSRAAVKVVGLVGNAIWLPREAINDG